MYAALCKFLGNRKSRKQAIRPSFRPRLEVLEDRVTPATYTWNGSVSTAWNNGSNWSAGCPANGPLVTDSVQFTSGNKPCSINLGANGSCNNFTITSGYTGTVTLANSGWSFAVNGNMSITGGATIQDNGTSFSVGGTLTLAASGLNTPTVNYGSNSTGNFTIGALSMSGGTITNSSGYINEISGSLTTSSWTGGSIDANSAGGGLQVDYGNTLNISGSSLSTGDTIIVYGTVNYGTSGNTVVSEWAGMVALKVTSDGTVNFKQNTTIQPTASYLNDSYPQIQDYGTVSMTNSSASLTVYGGIVVDQGGTFTTTSGNSIYLYREYTGMDQIQVGTAASDTVGTFTMGNGTSIYYYAGSNNGGGPYTSGNDFDLQCGSLYTLGSGTGTGATNMYREYTSVSGDELYVGSGGTVQLSSNAFTTGYAALNVSGGTDYAGNIEIAGTVQLGFFNGSGQNSKITCNGVITLDSGSIIETDMEGVAFTPTLNYTFLSSTASGSPLVNNGASVTGYSWNFVVWNAASLVCHD